MPTFQGPEDAPDELTALLLLASPRNEHGNKTLNHLAKLMGVTKWAMRKWIKSQRIPPQRVVQIVRLGEGRVDTKDFDAFVYKD